MWNNILQVNSVLWILSGVFLVYSAGNAILQWQWKQFLLSILLFALFSITAIIFSALQEP